MAQSEKLIGNRVVSRAFGSGQVLGWAWVGFGLKFVKMFRADFGPGYKT